MGNKMTIEDLYISVEDVYNQYESRKIDEVLATETLVRVCQHFASENAKGKEFLRKIVEDIQIQINRS
tara:strand:- start:230 stop:433 length:204 start_codon:yes stop_codon:yes gene_type:complete